jgi:hypothetical protein
MGQRPTPEFLIFASTRFLKLANVEQNRPPIQHEKRA